MLTKTKTENTLTPKIEAAVEKFRALTTEQSKNDWVIRTLEETKKQLEEHGWCQGAWVRPDGKICLGEALGRAVLICNGEPRWFERERSAAFQIQDKDQKAIEYVATELGVQGLMGIPTWNDAGGRVKEQLIIIINFAINARRRVL